MSYADPSKPAQPLSLPGPGPDTEKLVHAEQARRKAIEADNRLLAAWQAVRDFHRPDDDPSAMRLFVVSICHLVEILRTLGLERRMDEVAPRNDGEKAALAIYKSAKDRANLEQIVNELDVIERHCGEGDPAERRKWQIYYGQVDGGLRHSIMNRLLAPAKNVGTIGRDNPAPNDVEGDQVSGEPEPPLSQLQYDILEALRRLKATDAAKRATGEKIAPAAGGDATAQSVKQPLSDLKQRRLVDSKTGKGGGSWLTDQGLNLIDRVRPRRK